MTDLYDETDYFGTPESRDRDARLVGHEVKADGHGVYLSNEECQQLLAERDALEAENEGALAIITQERVEVLRLRAENQRFREALNFISGAVNWEINPSNYTHEEVCAMNSQWIEMGNTASSALEGDKP